MALSADYKELTDEELVQMLISGVSQTVPAGGDQHGLPANGSALPPPGAAEKRDSQALEALYDRYFRQCFALAVRILSNGAIAEEVVQEVFLKLWQAPYSFDQQRGRFPSWLLSVVHHRCVDELRKNRRLVSANISLDSDEGGDDLLTRLPDEQRGPEEAAWISEQRSNVRRALGKLSDVQRRVIELAYFGGMTQMEIASHLGEPLGTVKTRVRLALQKLKLALEAEGLGAE
jgi:RNA polymerase sigma-70 factor (ECF subfamily)